MYKAGLQCKWGIASNVVAQEGASLQLAHAMQLTLTQATAGQIEEIQILAS